MSSKLASKAFNYLCLVPLPRARACVLSVVILGTATSPFQRQYGLQLQSATKIPQHGCSVLISLRTLFQRLPSPYCDRLDRRTQRGASPQNFSSVHLPRSEPFLSILHVGNLTKISSVQFVILFESVQVLASQSQRLATTGVSDFALQHITITNVSSIKNCESSFSIVAARERNQTIIFSMFC